MLSWKNISIKPSASMKEVMQVIDKGAQQIALVLDDDCRLLGTVTDGDLRRAILQDMGFSTPVTKFMNSHPVTGLVDDGQHVWQRIMQKSVLKHLPILNDKGCVVRLVKYELPHEIERDNPVVLMAGGLGTRLHPITQKIPKPLINVGKKPILHTIIESFVEQGFSNIHLCVNYKSEMIRDYFGNGSKLGVNIRYHSENKRMGTAGALALIEDEFEKPVIVMNGDLLTKLDFKRLLDFHVDQNSAITVAMREHVYSVPYGVIKLQNEFSIIEMVEKPQEKFMISAGIYVINPNLIGHIPKNEYYDMPNFIQKLLNSGESICGFPLRDYWIDIGRLEDLEQAQLDLEHGIF